MPRLIPLTLVGVLLLGAAPLAAQATAEKVADGVLVALPGATLKVEVCTDDIIRIAYAPDRAFFDRASLVAAPKRCGGATWSVTTTPDIIVVRTGTVRALVSRTTGETPPSAGARHADAARADAIRSAVVRRKRRHPNTRSFRAEG